MRTISYRKWIDYVAGFFSLAAWITLFGSGLLISSGPYRSKLATSFSWTDLAAAVSLYTYTNVALLTCLAGVIGGVSSRLTFRKFEPISETQSESTLPDGQSVSISIAYRVESPLASMCRSFLVYLLYIAGLAIGIPGGTDALSDTNPAQYLRIAGLLSLLGFAVGYDPTLFHAILANIPAPIRKKTRE
ncbi:hypothetical protein [Methylocaldum szegediense]|uniref:Uncharacterized protein n=1 Tax=Methylocaldum szegediense TaxID=73780 RepID=A0ABN8XBR6_9GAMM|nr:hypothetical protein [Methylocaldum szegediense]CAI8961656.1 conserved membrane protein of unknown function [Methylocaldum szegediense]